MGWVKLDDGYPRHPKVLGLSDRAFRHDIVATCYCAEHDTDGVLPAAYVRAIPARVRAELIAAGKWDEVNGVVMVHDYLDYNPSKAERDATSNARSNASRKRWSKQVVLGDGTGTGLEEKEFARFWDAYPSRKGKRAAQLAFAKALKRGTADAIVAGAERYRDEPTRDPQFTAHPATWLNQDRWLDEATVAPTRKPRVNYADELRALKEGKA